MIPWLFKREIDVQLATGREHFATIDGIGEFTICLTSDQFHELRDQINDAWLNAQGLEMRCLTVEHIESGDIIPPFGKVRDWHWTDTAMQAADIFFTHGGRITTGSTTELTIHRVIQ